MAAESLDMLANRLTKCLSALKAELDSNISAAYTDTNKRAEVITRDLMNILYEKDLVLEARVNSAGFDLCDVDNMLMVQVTSNHTIGKITECLRTTTERVAKEPSLRGFDLQILFLTTGSKTTAKLTKQTKDKLPKLGLDLSGISFDPDDDILDFNSLLKKLRENEVSKSQMVRLTDLMDKYWPQIAEEAPPVDKVQGVIDLYIDNFEAPLFMHAGSKTVTLKNLYVEPDFTDPKYAASMPALLEDFIWNQGREKILLIEGGAAIGKTSLVSWLCYHHAHPTEDGNAGQTIFRGRPIVVVRLRELEFPNQKPSAAAILHYLQLPGTKAFFDDYPNAILILDGADELGLVSNVKTNAIEDFILDVQQTLGPYKLIVTSRPQFLEANNLKSFLFETRHITLYHFSRDKRKKWIENFKATGEALDPETEKYILSINDKDADGVADTPLALYLLADCRMQEDYKNNQWALYHAIFSEAITKAPYNAGSSPLLSTAHAAQNYDMVKAIAFRMFRNSGSERFYITKEELDEAARDAGLEGADAERVKETCVLCAYWKDTRTGALEFYHNNIRDFFLAEYFCDQLIQAFSALPKVLKPEVEDSYFECPEWDSLLEKINEMFCWAKINGSIWNQVFAFISLRLKAECGRADACDTMPELFSKNPALYRLMESLANSSALWRGSADIHPYHSAKNTLFNFLIVFQILLRHIPHDHSKRPILRYTNVGQTLLEDWSDLFESSYRMPNLEKIYLLDHFTLEGVNWAEKFFNYAAFSNCTFFRVFFCGSVLKNPAFSETDMLDADFSLARLYFATLNTVDSCNTVFEETRFQDCLISNSYFNDCNFRSTVFKTTKIGRVTLKKCDLSTASITKATGYRIIFDKCHLMSTYISDSHLEKTVFIDTDLIGATFNNTTLVDCRIEGQHTNLKITAFINVRTQNCTFRNVRPETAEILRSIGFTEET